MRAWHAGLASRACWYANDGAAQAACINMLPLCSCPDTTTVTNSLTAVISSTDSTQFSGQAVPIGALYDGPTAPACFGESTCLQRGYDYSADQAAATACSDQLGYAASECTFLYYDATQVYLDGSYFVFVCNEVAKGGGLCMVAAPGAVAYERDGAGEWVYDAVSGERVEVDVSVPGSVTDITWFDPGEWTAWLVDCDCDAHHYVYYCAATRTVIRDRP